MSAENELPDKSEIDDLAEMRARVTQHPDNKWEARADAAAAAQADAAPSTVSTEPKQPAAAEQPAAKQPDISDSRAREAMAAKTSRAREALAAKGTEDPTQPPQTLVVVVSIVSYIVGVLLGWGAGSWLDADPWPIAFAGVVGGVIGFLLGRGILRGVYALRS